jgi:drug/metabolite transporter (DMT)-like permease
VALFGWLCWSVLNFLELDLTRHFLAVLAGVLYSIYLLMSKKKYFSDGRTSFMTISILHQRYFLGVVCTLLDEPFFDFQTQVGLFIYSGGRMSIDSLLSTVSYTTHANHQGFIEFIRSSCFDIGISLVLLDEKITLNMIIGGLILLLGIRITFTPKHFR